MQPKVSMVVPCYNKVEWIGGMFESILAQKWDNIELIIVNNGSTDGTRGIITDYLPKFRERGYEVVFVDQDNQGVGAAVRNGLARASGDYVCMPDADDELDSEYVSAMAGWLWEHPEEQWVVCDSDWFNFDYSCNEGRAEAPVGRYPYKLLEGFIFKRYMQFVWNMMFRTDYMKQCRLPESFCVEPRVI